MAAREHGVAGAVLAGVRLARISPPRAAWQEAKYRQKIDTVWRDVLRDTLHEALHALARNGVATVALKGPLLAARLYDDAVVRPSVDLDLLVEPASLQTAAVALGSLGYEREGGEVGRFFRDHHHHVHLFHPARPPIELHFEAYRGFGTVLPAAPFLARSIPCAVPGWHEARVLAPEDEFLYLAVHAASHRFQLLVWLFDLKLFVLRHPDLRWDHIAILASAHRLSTVVSFVSALLSEWLGAPASGSAYLPAVGESRAFVVEQLARARTPHVVNAAASFLFSALLCDNVAQAAAFSRRFVRAKVFHEASLRARGLLSS